MGMEMDMVRIHSELIPCTLTSRSKYGALTHVKNTSSKIISSTHLYGQGLEVKGFIGTVPCRPIQRRILVLELF
jgi:hypothetical protein